MTRSKTTLSGHGSSRRKPTSAKSAVHDPTTSHRCLRVCGQKCSKMRQSPGKLCLNVVGCDIADRWIYASTTFNALAQQREPGRKCGEPQHPRCVHVRLPRELSRPGVAVTRVHRGAVPVPRPTPEQHLASPANR